MVEARVEMAASHSPQLEVRKAGAAQAWVLIFAMFLPIMAIIAIAPALPTLMDHFHNVPHFETLVPMMLTVPAICIALCGGIAGYLTDRFGRRNLLLAAMVAYLIGGVSPFFLQTFPEVMAGRVLLGVAEAFVLTIGNALLADYFAPDERNKWLMIQGMVGPFLASGLLAASGQLAARGWQWPFLAYSLTLPILLAAVLFVYEPERQREHQSQAQPETAFPTALITLVCCVTLFTSTLYFVEPIHYSLVLREIGVSDPALSGRISAVASLTVPLGAGIFKLVTKWKMNLQMTLVFSLMGIGLIGIGLLRDYHLSAAAALIQQTAAGMTIPILVSWALSSVPLEHRGRGMGLWAAAFFVGQFVNPLAIGALLRVTGGLLPTVTLCGTICLAAAVLSLFFSMKRQTI